MDISPIAKSDALNLLHSALESSAKSLIPIILNEGVNALAVSTACCDVTHKWTKPCGKAWFILLLKGFKNSLNVYGSLYLFSAIIRGRSLKYYYTRLPQEVIRSSTFLAVNCCNFLAGFCLSRKFFGNINYYGTLLANIPACFLAILVERKQRRGLLALYLTNLAAETGFNMMAHRKWITKMPNGEVLLFAFASAIYALLFKMKKLDGSYYKLLKKFIGSSETLDKDNYSGINRKSKISHTYDIILGYTNLLFKKFNATQNNLSFSNSFLHMMKDYGAKLENVLNKMSLSNKCKHTKCSHRYNCLIYSLTGFVQRFIVGFSLQFIIKIIGSLGKVIKNPKLLIKIFKNPVNKQLGMFFGAYVLIFRAVSCLQRWLTNSNDKINGLIPGFFAGWSMIFYKSSTIALYTNFKLLEILWMLGVADKKLPLFKSFDVVLYSLSTAFVLWVAIFEPHNIRHSYWKFMVNISDNKLKDVDRFALDVFGTDASLIDRLGKA